MASVLSFESNLCQVEKVTYLKVTQPGYRESERKMTHESVDGRAYGGSTRGDAQTEPLRLPVEPIRPTRWRRLGLGVVRDRATPLNARDWFRSSRRGSFKPFTPVRFSRISPECVTSQADTIP
jgi:hypothetical protein